MSVEERAHVATAAFRILLIRKGRLRKTSDGKKGTQRDNGQPSILKEHPESSERKEGAQDKDDIF